MSTAVEDKSESADTSAGEGGESSTPGVRYGTDDYVEYVVGGARSKLVISATHGGNLRPKGMPSRSENPEGQTLRESTEISINADVYTKELATLLRTELLKLCDDDEAPHLIICHLHRSRVDMNRNVEEGCMKVTQAVTAHQEFHNFIQEACKTVGTGLLLDIHGHTHKEGLAELGYLILNCDLASGRLDPEKSSIHALASRSCYAFEDLIRGPVSLGTLLQGQGIEVVPSATHPKAEGSCFTGGHTVRKHGSLESGCVDAIQVEVHRKHRCVENAPSFACSLATAVKHFIDLHYDETIVNHV